MIRQFLTWRILLALIAILIVSGTIFYSKYLANKIAKEERQKVEEWVEASNTLLNIKDSTNTALALKINTNNDDIPIIVTDEKDKIIEYVNLDSTRTSDPNYLQKKLKKLKSINDPLIYVDPFDSTKINKYYYGHTTLLAEVQYYPIVQLLIVGLFILVTILALRSSYRSVQNQVWAGMAKETAHQLGTPVSSLEGWVEMLKQNKVDHKIVSELEKDVDRLRLVSDRFGKIGSKPQLEETNITAQISYMVEYVKKRAAGKVNFIIQNHSDQEVIAKISAPLFDWVIENLLKNALDSMEGKGTIRVDLYDQPDMITIDISDSGKGISKQNISKVFNPGFTTKKKRMGTGFKPFKTHHRAVS